LDLVPRSGANLAAVEGIEPWNPLPIVLDSVLVERNGPKRIVRRSLAEPVRDRRCVRERLLVDVPDDAEIYNGQASKQRVKIGSVVILELLLGTEGNFVAVGISVGDGDVLDGNSVQRLELRRYFGPRRGLNEGDAACYAVFSELELSRGRHGRG
jgi:hypothetical protein